MRLQYAEIQWDESGLPYSPMFADIYHSRQGGLEESEQVFLNGNRLKQRFAELPDSAGIFTIAEIGFGSGLNFLLTWQLWQQYAPSSQSLHYLAFEQYPIDNHSLRRIYRQWPQLQVLTSKLLKQLPGNCAGIHRLPLENQVCLDLYLGDAQTMLEQKHCFQTFEKKDRESNNRQALVDAWFLDGFSPAKNPQLWSLELFQLVAANSGSATTVSSYSVASAVINALQACGFHTEKQAGFGTKRHMLAGQYQTSDKPYTQPKATKAPWFNMQFHSAKTKTALVIGAGLAGSNTAYSLARRGWKVLVVDSGRQIASAASGNPQAALQCRLMQQASPAAGFYLQAYLYALNLYKNGTPGKTSPWHGCGVLQLPDALNKRKPLSIDTIERLYPESIVAQLTLAETRHQCNAQLRQAAWHFPQGGWLDPSLLCQCLLEHENIVLRLNTQVKSLAASDDGWTAIGNADSVVIGKASVVVIANSYSAAAFAQTKEIPLLSSQGQISQLASTPRSEKLSAVVSGSRAIYPASQGRHMLGASYSATDEDPSPSSAVDKEIFSAVNQLFAEPDFLSPETIDSRVSVRCNSRDQLPVVGMVPKHSENLQRYGELAKNARRLSNQNASYYQGLYINVAHGSYGLGSCPLSAEYLSSLVNNEHSPLTREQMDCLNPIRFLIRDLKKQKAGPGKD